MRTSPSRGVRHREEFAIARRVAACLGLLVALTAVPAGAFAGPPCAQAMFTCRGKVKVDGQVHDVSHGKNLRQLVLQEHRSLHWVRRNCRVQDADPFECDWKRNVREGYLPGGPARKPSRAAVGPPSGPRRVAPHPPPARGRPRGAYAGVRPAPSRAQVGRARERLFGAEIAAAAARYRLPADLIAAVMTVESAGNPRAVSAAGARGLMQLMPAVAKAMGVLDPFDPAQSIRGGARYLRILANRFAGDIVKVLSAYHAGSSRVKKRGGTPFAATDSYVRKVLRMYYALRDG